MRVELFPEQTIGSNVYQLHFGGNKLLIDAGCPVSAFSSDDKNFSGILCTHGHYDHILHLDEIAKKLHLSVFAYEKEIPAFTSPEKNVSYLFNQSFIIKSSITGLCDGQILTADFFPFTDISEKDWKITVIHTPGHTIGSVCYFYEDQSGDPPALFSGDTVFKNSIGRTDLSGNPDDLFTSIVKIKQLPDQTIIYPGHGPITTLEQEKKENPYFF